MSDVTTMRRTDDETEKAGPTATGGLKDAGLGVVRIVVAFLFMCHGAMGLLGWFGGIDGQGTAVPVGSWPGWYGSLIELVAGGLVLLGLFTRPAAILCSGAMAYAYFVVHQPEGLLPLQNMGEQAALYSWIFLLIAILGPGSFALDSLFRRGRKAA
jgi:putative oxidoreductase